MVQQLSLSSTFPANQFQTVRKTLQALTGLRPEPLARHTVIMKPKFLYTSENNPKMNQIESYRIRMTRVWQGDDSRHGESVVGLYGTSSNAGAAQAASALSASINDSIWTVQLSDIPAGGNRPVSIQNTHEATIYKTDNVLGYMDELGFMPETEFWVSGFQFYYNDVIIELSRLSVKDKEAVTEGDNALRVPLKLLDRSEKWQVRAFVNVSKLNDLDSVAQSVKELELLKKDLTGLIDLHVPDRADMDSRVGSRIAARRRTPA